MRVWWTATVISLGGVALLACSLVVGVGDYSSGGGPPTCVALATCCAGGVPTSDEKACQNVASAGNAVQCEHQLMEYETAGMCIGGFTCANPPASAQSQFIPPMHFLPRSCTMTELDGWATCLVGDLNNADPGEPDCDGIVHGQDGGTTSCGLCLTGHTVSPIEALPTAWGAWTAVDVYGILGNAATLHSVSLGPSAASCLAARAANQEILNCAIAALESEACALYVCLPLCAVATKEDESAFANCVSTTAAGACNEYNLQTTTNCMMSGVVGAYDTCNTLATATGSATGTMAQQAEFLNLVCGAFDAGL